MGCCAQCQGIRQEFGDGVARRELRRYRRRGPTGTTRSLLEALRRGGIGGCSFLDIGGGVGVIQHELLLAGAASGTSVDASPAYLDAARSEAQRRGIDRRMQYREGDFVELASTLPDADVVTLDRVLCCYPDMPALVDASARRARRFWGAVIPREERRAVRLGIAFINLVQRLRRRPFRVFGHPRIDIERRLRNLGFDGYFESTSFLWRVLVFERHDGGADDSSRGVDAEALAPPDRPRGTPDTPTPDAS